MIKTSGLDATMLVRLYGLGMKLFAVFTILGVGLLIPLNFTGNNGVNGFESLSLSNVRIGADRYWAHLLCAYAFTFYTFFQLLLFWDQYQTDRYAYLTDQHLHHQRLSLLVHNIPTSYRSDVGLQQIFSRFFPKTISHTYMAKDFTRLNELITKRDEQIAALETALAEKAEFEHSNQSEKRPQTALKCLCLNKVDAIDYYTNELDKLNNEIVEEQKKEPSILQSGFVSVNNVVALTSILRQQKTVNAFEFETKLAPEPRDIYWPSLNFTQYDRFIRTTIMDVAVFFLIVFWSIPVAFIQSLATLQTIAENVFFLSWVTSIPVALQGIIEGILPSLVLTLFNYFLPIILKQMTIIQGVECNSWIQMSVLEKFFLFQLLNNLLFLTAASTIFDKLTEIINTPTSIVTYLGESIPVTATFFITYIMLQTLSVLPLSLLDIGRLLIGLLKKNYFVKTERELVEIEKAPEWDYGAEYPTVLFLFVVSFTYSVISPIIIPFSACFFTVGFVVKRYHALYSIQNQFESGGLFWPAVFNKLITCILTSQIVLVGLFGLKQVPGPAALTVPLPFITLAFQKYCLRKYPDGLCVLPLELANGCEQKRREIERLARSSGGKGGDGGVGLGISDRQEELGKAGTSAAVSTRDGSRTPSLTHSSNQLVGVVRKAAVRGGEEEEEEEEDESKESGSGVRFDLAPNIQQGSIDSFSQHPRLLNNRDDYRQTALVAPPIIPPPEVVQLAKGGEIQGVRREMGIEAGSV